jgi:hypothetical protein
MILFHLCSFRNVFFIFILVYFRSSEICCWHRDRHKVHSKSAPTIPSYYPFQQHLRSRWSLTRRNYEGVVGQRCLQPMECQVDQVQQQLHMHQQLSNRSILHSYRSYLTQ